MNCLIIDDEPAARDILKMYVEDTPELKLAGICKDALEARSWLEDHTADLLFVDINMPKLSGLSFIKTLSDPPLIILTTAYSEHALDGFDLGVVDYLLKPFSFERFLQSVEKAGRQFRQPNNDHNNSLTVKADGKLYRMNTDEILYAESQGDYITLHTKERKVTFYETLGRFVQECPGNTLVRVHRSWVVNLSNIDYVEGNMIRIGDKTIPIGNSYKDEFMERYR